MRRKLPRARRSEVYLRRPQARPVLYKQYWKDPMSENTKLRDALESCVQIMEKLPTLGGFDGLAVLENGRDVLREIGATPESVERSSTSAADSETIALYELEQALEVALMNVRRDISMNKGQQQRPVHDSELLDQHRYRVAAMQRVLGCFAKWIV